MKIEIRLKNLLQKHTLDRHGVIKQIADETKVDRHKISAYYKNEVSKISLDVLASICLWLQRKGVPATELPGSILGTRPSELWQAITKPGKVTIYLGEYQQTEPPAAAWRWIARRDAAAAADLIQELSTSSEIGVPLPQVNIEYVPFRWDQEITDVTKKPLVEDIKRAKKIFERLRAEILYNTPILIGSQRVNYLLEYFVAHLFNCQPFSHEAGQFDVPFYLVYRHVDRRVQSCFGGLESPFPGKRKSVPGISYLDKSGKWVTCPWKAYEKDSGVIITLYDSSTEATEMVVFGFSGRATDAMSNILMLNKDRFWPPPVNVRNKQIGIYICQFDFAKRANINENEELQVTNLDIISLDENILRKYLK